MLMTNPGTRPDETAAKPSGRDQLKRLLEQGASTFPQQLRLILALSQVNAARSTQMPYPEKPLTLRQARLAILSEMVEKLAPAAVKKLIKDAQQIGDATVRLPLLARLAVKLPAHEYKAVVRDVWQQMKTIVDPAAQAQTLFAVAPLLLLVHDEPATPSVLLQLVSIAQRMKNLEARLRSLIALQARLPHEVALRTFKRILSELSETRSDSLMARSLLGLASNIPPDMEQNALDTAQRIKDPVERAQALNALARHSSPALQASIREAALSAIHEIVGEEERADALVNFAPHLESATPDHYPAVLERALSIALTITRRPVRARVLVGLAPHLTHDLQGEALAAVQRISAERERANLLTELAPQLPAEMLIPCLMIAHNMQEQDARVHALCVLAHHVPASARNQTMLDALAAASNLPHHFERVRALVSLVDILPPSMREQALTNALETTRLIENENSKARSLNLLGGHLTPPLLQRALELAQNLDNPQQRLNALLGIIAALQGAEYDQTIESLLLYARQLPLEYKRARALIGVVPHLPLAKLGEVTELTDKFDEPVDRVSVYVPIIQHLPPDQRPPVIAKAWSALQKIEDGYDRASAMVALAPFLPPSAAEMLKAAVLKAVTAIQDEYDQASAIAILAPLVTEEGTIDTSVLPDGRSALERGILTALNVPQQTLRTQLLQQGAQQYAEVATPEQAYDLWCEVVATFITLPMPDTLLCIHALLPLIRLFAGEKGIHEIGLLLGGK
jgi:hypothetical protein